MKTLKWITMVSVVAVGTASISMASSGVERMNPFKLADTNKDGTVTHAEMMAGVSTRFAKFDTNGDGFIELAELPKDMSQLMPHKHQKKKLDESKHKTLKSGSHDEEALRGHKRGHMRAMKHQKPSRIKFLARMDRDGDEKISLVEFSRRPTKMFKRADANGDGMVTADEAKVARMHRGKGGLHKRMKKHH